MSVGSVILTNLCPTALSPTRTSTPKSTPSGTTWRNASTMCLHSRIVVLLVEGDPGEGHLCFFYLPPVGQESRLPVAGRGAYDGYLEVQGVPENFEQPATDQLLGARQGRPQLGPQDDPGRISACLVRGVNEHLLCPTPLYLGLRNPSVRPMGTVTVTLCHWDRVLHASSLTTRDGFNRSDAHLSIFPFSAGNRWVSTSHNYRTNGSKVEYLKMQATSEGRSPGFTGKMCWNSNEECISRHMIARDLHREWFSGGARGGEPFACTSSGRNPLARIIHEGS